MNADHFDLTSLAEDPPATSRHALPNLNAVACVERGKLGGVCLNGAAFPPKHCCTTPSSTSTPSRMVQNGD